MGNVEIGFAGLGAVILLIALRMPIAVALGGVSYLGIMVLRGPDVAFGLLKAVPFEFAAHWSMTAIPMFILMGCVAHHTGVSLALFRAARLWFGTAPGGLAVATNFACAGFSAACGSSAATAAAMGRLAIPEMLRHGYDKGLATGVVAASGTLGVMIPPSIMFVLYGVFAEVSISKLLIAGILPGLLTAAVYTVMLTVRCKLNPALAPLTELDAKWRERFLALGPVWPLLVIIGGVIGGLYSGLVTPTEAGAFGAFLAFLVAAMQGRLSWRAMADSIDEAVVTTARLFFVAVGAALLTKFLALSGLPFFLANLVGDWALEPLLLVLAASLIYVVLGMFLDSVGLMLLTLPVLLPMFKALDLDLIWFGVIVVKFIEIGLLTPPVGFNAYVVKSVVGDEIRLETIFRGIGWFLLCELIIVAMLVAYPQISLYLPSRM